jgi:hypothetical protein
VPASAETCRVIALSQCHDFWIDTNGAVQHRWAQTGSSSTGGSFAPSGSESLNQVVGIPNNAQGGTLGTPIFIANQIHLFYASSFAYGADLVHMWQWLDVSGYPHWASEVLDGSPTGRASGTQEGIVAPDKSTRMIVIGVPGGSPSIGVAFDMRMPNGDTVDRKVTFATGWVASSVSVKALVSCPDGWTFYTHQCHLFKVVGAGDLFHYWWAQGPSYDQKSEVLDRGAVAGTIAKPVYFGDQLQVFYVSDSPNYGDLRHLWFTPSAGVWKAETLDGSVNPVGVGSADGVVNRTLPPAVAVAPDGRSLWVTYTMAMPAGWTDSRAAISSLGDLTWTVASTLSVTTAPGGTTSFGGGVPLTPNQFDWATAPFGTNQNIGRNIGNVSCEGQSHVFAVAWNTGDLVHYWRQSDGEPAGGGLAGTALDGPWKVETLDGAGGDWGRTTNFVGEYVQAICYGGTVHVFYFDSPFGDLRHAWWHAPPGELGFWKFESLDGQSFPNVRGSYGSTTGTDISVAEYGGQLHVFYAEWTANGSHRLRHAWYGAGIGWSAETLDGQGAVTAGATSNDVGLRTSAYVMGGQLHVFYFDRTNADLRHMWNSFGAPWKSETLDGSANSTSGRPALVGFGSAAVQTAGGDATQSAIQRVFYQDTTSGGIRLAEFDPSKYGVGSTGWTFRPLDGASGAICLGALGTFASDAPIRAVSINNTPHVFYFAVDSGSHRVLRQAWREANGSWTCQTVDGAGGTAKTTDSLNFGLAVDVEHKPVQGVDVENEHIQVVYYDTVMNTMRVGASLKNRIPGAPNIAAGPPEVAHSVKPAFRVVSPLDKDFGDQVWTNLQMSTDPTFGDPSKLVYDGAPVMSAYPLQSSTEFVASGLLWNTQYYYRACAWDYHALYGTNAFLRQTLQKCTASQAYRPLNRPPSASVVIDPRTDARNDIRAGAVHAQQPFLTGQAAVDPDGDPVRYRFEVSTLAGAVVLSSEWASAPGYQVPKMKLWDNTQYRFRILTADSLGSPEVSSAFGSLTVVNKAPSSPGATSVAQSATTTTFGASLASDLDSDQISYFFRVQPLNGTSFLSPPLSTPRWVMPNAFVQPGLPYTVTAIAMDWRSTTEGTAAAAAMVNHAPTAPTNVTVTPQVVDRNTTGTVTIGWQAASDVDGNLARYVIEIFDGSTLKRRIEAGPGQLTRTVRIAQLEAKSYRIVVKAVDSGYQPRSTASIGTTLSIVNPIAGAGEAEPTKVAGLQSCITVRTPLSASVLDAAKDCIGAVTDSLTSNSLPSWKTGFCGNQSISVGIGWFEISEEVAGCLWKFDGDRRLMPSVGFGPSIGASVGASIGASVGAAFTNATKASDLTGRAICLSGLAADGVGAAGAICLGYRGSLGAFDPPNPDDLPYNMCPGMSSPTYDPGSGQFQLTGIWTAYAGLAVGAGTSISVGTMATQNCDFPVDF